MAYIFALEVRFIWRGNMASFVGMGDCLNTVTSCGMFDRGIISVAVEGPTTAVNMTNRGMSVTKIIFRDEGISRDVIEEKKSRDQR